MLTIDEFNQKYNLNRAHLHVAINNGTIPKEVITKVKHNYASIDEEFFVRRNNFKRKVIKYNQDMYFLLSTICSDAMIAKMIGVSHPFVTYNMWQLDDSSIVSYRVNGSHWKAFRFFRKVQIAIKRRFDIEFDIEKILDEEVTLAHGKKSKYFHINDKRFHSFIRSRFGHDRGMVKEEQTECAVQERTDTTHNARAYTWQEHTA